MTLVLLLISVIFNVTKGSCSWSIHGYGKVDLSPLSIYKLTVVRDGADEYKLEYTPCDNGINCEMKEASAVAMAVEMGPNDDTNCNGVISKWSNGITKPRHEINENDEDQIVFDYPVQETISGDACTEGRKGEFIFICAKYADPYQDPFFYQDVGSNPCRYHTIIRTKYACSIEGSGDDVLSNHGLSAGWIAIVIFLSIITVYCLIGYIMNGELPQFQSFWVYLPSLVKSGCFVSIEYLRSKICGKRADVDTSHLVDFLDDDDDNNY